jgi:hypothetical protein
MEFFVSSVLYRSSNGQQWAANGTQKAENKWVNSLAAHFG